MPPCGGGARAGRTREVKHPQSQNPPFPASTPSPVFFPPAHLCLLSGAASLTGENWPCPSQVQGGRLRRGLGWPCAHGVRGGLAARAGRMGDCPVLGFPGGIYPPTLPHRPQRRRSWCLVCVPTCARASLGLHWCSLTLPLASAK